MKDKQWQGEGFSLSLLTWYREVGRDLPWRGQKDPYPIWVSEIMLQQTRVVAVVDYYQRFLAQLPEISALAHCQEDKLLKLWQGLGYYNRARNLQKGAQQIQERHQGIFPSTYPEIRDLAGIGDYTAGAIASIAFDLPHGAVDGNVLRVMARLTADREDITRPSMKKKTQDWVEAWMPLAYPGDYNQALMELGATICLPNGAPHCHRCPVAGFCQSQEEERWREIPVKARKKPRKIQERQVFLLYAGEQILLRRRPSRGLLAGLWEFPHVLLGEDPPLPGLDLEALEPFGTGTHIFTHLEWHMRGFRGQVEGLALPEGYLWASPQELKEIYAIPSAFSWVDF